jgi:hypothetical protein
MILTHNFWLFLNLYMYVCPADNLKEYITPLKQDFPEVFIEIAKYTNS